MKNNLVILGAGESGYGAAVLGKAKGWNVFVSDNGLMKPEYLEKFSRLGVKFEQNGHNETRIFNADVIVKSPGVPENAPIVVKAREKGIRVESEIEFAGKYTSAKKICITGSNGKTTTTTLIYDIMRGSGAKVAVAGNIGESFAEKVAKETDGEIDWYVIELSSFQLDGMYDFKADIGLLLNITPDHLNRYDYKMENYVNSKLRIAQNLQESEFFVVNADDPETQNAISRVTSMGTKITFSAKSKTGDAYFDGTNITFEDFTFPVCDLQIKGIHNIANALAAVIACKKAKVCNGDLAKGLKNFKGVEHRLEPVIEFNGVQWINDSKATNVDSVIYALGAMTRPTIWIAGGTDKGNDYSLLTDLAKEHVKALVCMGLDNKKLVDSFTGIVPDVFDTNSLEDAMNKCREIATKGDCVLLSPACASFDLFKNYEHRGKCFKEDVIAHSK